MDTPCVFYKIVRSRSGAHLAAFAELLQWPAVPATVKARICGCTYVPMRGITQVLSKCLNGRNYSVI